MIDHVTDGVINNVTHTTDGLITSNVIIKLRLRSLWWKKELEIQIVSFRDLSHQRSYHLHN